MNFSQDDMKRIENFYNSLIANNGYNTPQSLSWNNKYTQTIRFLILSQIADLENKSILDVGCGFGDLYSFLSEKYKNFNYTGIDILPSMIECAKKNYPDIEFIQTDFSSHLVSNYDIIFASGSLSFKISDYKKIYFGMIEKMFKSSTVAAGFNMLNAKSHVDNDTFASYHLPEIYEFCTGLTDKIIIRQDYLPHDFTFYLYH